MFFVKIKNLSKFFRQGKNQPPIYAINQFNLNIRKGEFIVIVGPSGCGKSTLLNCLAGLETLSTGEIWLNQTRYDILSPQQRNVGMMFQNFSLLPHLAVTQNIALGLRGKKLEIKQKVEQISKLLGIERFLNLKTDSLSGGEKQRVALAQAMIKSPNLFLLDEPLSNLDTHLKIQIRREIKKAHLLFKNTFIYVTHDQQEAITLADRVVVMNNGKIEQVASPQVLYQKPVNTFVAQFIGSFSMNILRGHLVNQNGRWYFKLIDGVQTDNLIFLPKLESNLNSKQQKKVCFLGIRPEDMVISNDKRVDFDFKGSILWQELLEKGQLIKFKWGNFSITVLISENNRSLFQNKENIRLKILKYHLFDSNDCLIT